MLIGSETETFPTTGQIPDITTEQGRTDLANGERFASQHQGKLLYCAPMRRWLVWDGKRWLIDENGQAVKFAMDTAKSVFADALGQGSETRKFAAASASKRGMEAMLSLAGPLMPVTVKQLNTHPFLINCPNGTLDLRSGQLRPHDPADLLTTLCPTEFDPDATSDEWDKFIVDITCGDAELSQFLCEFSGYCLTGDVTERILVILHGGGANGKTTFMNLLMETIGDDHCVTAPLGMLTSKAERHPTELADLFGARLVNSEETDSGQSLSEAKVKQLTGGGRVKGRGMGKDFFSFYPTHKLILQTNHKPRIQGTDDAIWDRVRMIPFNARFDGATRDSRITERLLEHRQSILAWAAVGCQKWLQCGLSMPGSVDRATAKYRADEDKIGTFIRERCKLEGSVKLSDFISELSKWSETSWKRGDVTSYLKEHGYEEFKSSVTHYRGLSL